MIPDGKYKQQPFPPMSQDCQCQIDRKTLSIVEMRLENSLNAVFQAVSAMAQTWTSNATEPVAPKLGFLYTAYVECAPRIAYHGPFGIRNVIPITGGNFSGPVMSGTVLPSPSVVLLGNAHKV